MKLSAWDMPDPTTQSNYLQVYTSNVDFDWTLDFEKQVLEGAATHTLLARETGIEEVMYIYFRFCCLWVLLTILISEVSTLLI